MLAGLYSIPGITPQNVFAVISGAGKVESNHRISRDGHTLLETLVTKLAGFTLLRDISSFAFVITCLFITPGKKGVKMKKRRAERPAVESKSSMKLGVEDRISILLTVLQPALITMQALSASVESLHYFQVSPIVSHCDKVQDNLTQ